MAQTPVYVHIPCPNGKHSQSVVTFLNSTVAAMFCVECERAWTEPCSNPALRGLPTTDFRDIRKPGE